MSWPATPPAHVTQLRTQWNACASWAAASGVIGRIHYPFVNVSGERGTADPIIALLIESAPTQRRPFAEGAKGVLAGEFVVVLYLPAATYPDAASCEALADAIIAELTGQQDGMIWGEPQRGDASSPSPAARAADTAGKTTDFRSVRIVLPWGLQP